MIVINIDDVIFQLRLGKNCFKFRRDDLNEFCKNHSFEIILHQRSGSISFSEINENFDKTYWEAAKPLYIKMLEPKMVITFDNPEDELMFKLIY